MTRLAVIWAIGGFSLLLLWAIIRLGSVSLESLQTSLTPLQWSILVANVAFMAWSEGYRGFQRGYAPRFAERVCRLRDSGTPLRFALAPFYAMGFFGAEKRRLLITWVMTFAIIGLIIVFHQIPQPWRGILDAGVVVGLSWGLLACWIQCAKQLTETPATPVPEVKISKANTSEA